MKSVGVEESLDVLVSVLRACAKEGDVAEAERTWIKIISSNNKPPTQAFLCLMDVYSRVGKPIKCLEIFRIMQERISSSVVSYYKVIEVLCKAQEIELAESLMTEFINSGMKPLMPSFIAIMNMYANLSLHGKVESTFFWCLEKCCPNRNVYNLYLDSLVQTENLAKAEQIFNQMHADEAIGVNTRSCNTILRGYLASREHLEFKPGRSKKINKLEAQQGTERDPDSLLLGGLRVKIDEEKKSYAVRFVFRGNSNTRSFLKRHIYNQFHEWLADKLPVDDNDHDDDIPCEFTTISHSYFKFYADQFWPQGIPSIPNLIHRWLTPRILAYWYMYGGYRTSSGDILLKLKSRKEDVQRIAKAFKAKSLNSRIKWKGQDSRASILVVIQTLTEALQIIAMITLHLISSNGGFLHVLFFLFAKGSWTRFSLSPIFCLTNMMRPKLLCGEDKSFPRHSKFFSVRVAVNLELLAMEPGNGMG
ncbi:UNVERIFIED_CONTAM: Pentatricopeptide repeat-containing protein, chloroplastic [Sesamum latifolium]|uniref:Pentatricopeptide repeat-containing protein, chloroplastic n=1 Tax=Sesamum latifolium TaxID=2727402 RepID=A0AAW2V103_9LAMI